MKAVPLKDYLRRSNKVITGNTPLAHTMHVAGIKVYDAPSVNSMLSPNTRHLTKRMRRKGLSANNAQGANHGNHALLPVIGAILILSSSIISGVTISYFMQLEADLGLLLTVAIVFVTLCGIFLIAPAPSRTHHPHTTQSGVEVEPFCRWLSIHSSHPRFITELTNSVKEIRMRCPDAHFWIHYRGTVHTVVVVCGDEQFHIAFWIGDIPTIEDGAY